MRVSFKGVEYNTTSRGVLTGVKFERQFGIAYAEAFPEGLAPRLEWMSFLAYTELQGDLGAEAVGPFNDDFLVALDFLPPTAEELATAAEEPAATVAPLGQEALPI